MESDLLARGILAGIMFAVFCHSIWDRNYGAALLSALISIAMIG